MRSKFDRVAAENLFVREEKSLDEVAALTGVSKATLAKWSKDGGWAQRRGERQRKSPQASLDVLQRQRELKIARMDGHEADDGAIDALNKLDQIIARAESRVGAIGPMLAAMERFSMFVTTHRKPEECAVVRDCIKQYFQQVRSENG